MVKTFLRDNAKIILCTFLMTMCILSSGLLTSCDAQTQFAQEAYDAKYKSEYATTINKLEMQEGDFKVYRRVIFYNVRLGETVFACEGYSHIQIDKDGDVEIVIKDENGKFLRHYLGQKQDITYFSEQIQGEYVPNNRKYRITFNPKLWIPKFEVR